jgi:hypothetical protein
MSGQVTAGPKTRQFEAVLVTSNDDGRRLAPE